MSMRDNNTRFTICEVLRQINDRVQGDEYTDVRDMLAYAERMAKKMAAKLQEYNAKEDPMWWVKNNAVKEKIDRQMQEYLAGDAERGRILLEGE